MPQVFDVVEEPSLGGKASLAGGASELDVWSVTSLQAWTLEAYLL